MKHSIHIQLDQRKMSDHNAQTEVPIPTLQHDWRSIVVLKLTRSDDLRVESNVSGLNWGQVHRVTDNVEESEKEKTTTTTEQLRFVTRLAVTPERSPDC